MSHSYDMYSVQNMVNNFIIFVWWQMVTRLTIVIILKHVEILHHFIVQQELK